MSLDDDPVRDLCAFIDDAPCPALAAIELQRRLAAAGFKPLSLTAPKWELSLGRHVVVQGGAVIAFVLQSTRLGRFQIIGAHTDSPHLKLKPNAAHSACGCLKLGVEVYGGALHHTWLDRDLGLAGTVHLDDGRTIPVRLHRAVARVPALAIHLDRTVNEQGLKLNPQLHLDPLWGLVQEGDDAAALFRQVLAEAAGIGGDRIVSHDLSLYDLQAAALIGAGREFVSAPRLDNLSSCHAGLHALLAAADGELAPGVVPVLACLDHEEVGSESRDGAEGSLLGTVLERLALALGVPREGYLAACAGSLLISADTAHAQHPNHADKHDPRHAPLLGKGPVLKRNHNQRYATSGATAAAVHRYAIAASVPVQDFATRGDIGCGSTIGPACAARLGMAVADVGLPILSMHSARELMAAADHAPFIALLTAHLKG